MKDQRVVTAILRDLVQGLGGQAVQAMFPPGYTFKVNAHATGCQAVIKLLRMPHPAFVAWEGSLWYGPKAARKVVDKALGIQPEADEATLESLFAKLEAAHDRYNQQKIETAPAEMPLASLDRALILMPAGSEIDPELNEPTPLAQLYRDEIWEAFRANQGGIRLGDVLVLSSDFGVRPAWHLERPYTETKLTEARVDEFIGEGFPSSLEETRERRRFVPYERVILACSKEHRRFYLWLIGQLRDENVITATAPIMRVAGTATTQSLQLEAHLADVRRLASTPKTDVDRKIAKLVRHFLRVDLDDNSLDGSTIPSSALRLLLAAVYQAGQHDPKKMTAGQKKKKKKKGKASPVAAVSAAE